uniref:Putative secreted peptide n=1 Tax=Anopheles braziliensis TaxID=58242 RepID=A0A2M3ZQC5_9DIPT
MVIYACSTYLFIVCIERPAIAVTVSDSSRSLLYAWRAGSPTVCANRFRHGQCDICMAIVFCSVSIAAWHGARASSLDSMMTVLSAPNRALMHSSAESQIAGKS